MGVGLGVGAGAGAGVQCTVERDAGWFAAAAAEGAASTLGDDPDGAGVAADDATGALAEGT